MGEYVAEMLQAGATQYGHEELCALKLMAASWRKWITYGHTYTTKYIGFLELARWNWKCGRNLDALAYAAKLMRSRADCLASSNLPTPDPNPAVWAVAAAADGSFTVHSHNDGRITASGADGRTLRWGLDGEVAKKVGLELDPRGNAIRRTGHKQFWARHWHGPYARALLLEEIDGDHNGNRRYLLAFSFKADKPQGEKSAERWLCAMIVSVPLDGKEIVVIGTPSRTPIEHAVYSMILLARRGPRSREELCALVGTRGDAIPDPARDEAPFFEVHLTIDGNAVGVSRTALVTLAAPRSGDARLDADNRSELKSTGYNKYSQYNPVWCLAVSPDLPAGNTPAGNVVWTWTGQHDGMIRLFKGTEDHPSISSTDVATGITKPDGAGDVPWYRWERSSGDGKHVESRPPVGAPVSRIAVGRDAQGGELLAFGTSTGIVGVWATPEMDAAGAAQEATQDSPDAPADDSADRCWMLVHSREAGWITGLAFYEDEDGSSRGTKALRLLATNDNGIVALYDVARGIVRRLANTHTTGSSLDDRNNVCHRRWPSGTRLDRFRLRLTSAYEAPPLSIRALVLLDGDKATACKPLEIYRKHLSPGTEEKPTGEKPPLLIMGLATGQVRHYTLAVPRTTGRRKKLIGICKQIFDPDQVEKVRNLTDAAQRRRLLPEKESLTSAFGYAGAMGPEWVWRWLRVQDQSDDEVLRYSLWMEIGRENDRLLGAIDEWLNSRSSDAPKDQIDEHRARHDALLNELTEEVYRRQPFSKEPVKVLWDLLAKLGNMILTRALLQPGGPIQERLLGIYRMLAERVESLCNRWIGFNHDLEPLVLVHSFNAFMDWPVVFLLAVPGVASDRKDEHDDDKDRPHEALRQMIVQVFLQPRLFHPDVVVPTEALRTLNLAILRALDRRMRTKSAFAGAAYKPIARGKAGPNFMAVMTLVGTMAERRRDALVPSDPLFTELTRFFALCLLLLPESALAVGLVVSESRVYRGQMDTYDVAIRIAVKARAIMTQLDNEFDLPRRSEHRRALDRSIELFRQYLSRDWQKSPVDKETKKALLEDKPSAWYLDEDIHYERQLVAKAFNQLLDLGEPNKAIESNEIKAFTNPDSRCRYFKHTKACFVELAELRLKAHQALWTTVPGRGAGGADEAADATPAEPFEKICTDADVFLTEKARLYEPQRTQYRSIIDAWRRRNDQVRGRTAQILKSLDRFNRHRHQAATFDLMAVLRALIIRDSAQRGRPLSYAARFAKKADANKIYRESLRTILQDHTKDDELLRKLQVRTMSLVDEAQLWAALLGAVQSVSQPRGSVVEQLSAIEVYDEIELLAGDFGLRPEMDRGAFKGKQVVGPRQVWSAILRELLNNINKYSLVESSTPGTKDFVVAFLSESLAEGGAAAHREGQPEVFALYIAGKGNLSQLVLDDAKEEQGDALKRQGDALKRQEDALWDAYFNIGTEGYVLPKIPYGEAPTGSGLVLVKELCGIVGLSLEFGCIPNRNALTLLWELVTELPKDSQQENATRDNWRHRILATSDDFLNAPLSYIIRPALDKISKMPTVIEIMKKCLNRG